MLYRINRMGNKDEYQKVKRVSFDQIGWKEKDLENLLAKNIYDLISSTELMAIFTQRPMQEEPDILALDKQGDLYILELKRWSGQSENLLQVLRYGQLYGGSDYTELNEIYQKYQKVRHLDQEKLLKDHQRYFQLDDDAALKTADFNQKQHFLVVVNGLDQKTVEAILYWKKNGLNIDAVVYWVFEIGSEYYIEFNMYSPNEQLLEYESNFYVLNTNSGNNPQHTKDMIQQQKAAAYYPGWREKIAKLQKDDTVFLYQNGKGIIAYGRADGKLKKAPCDGFEDYEYYMKLNDFTLLSDPISATEMKTLANKGFPFLQTMYVVSEEVAKCFIDRACKE